MITKLFILETFKAISSKTNQSFMRIPILSNTMYRQQQQWL